MSVENLDSGNYDEFVAGQGLVLVDFWAEWCSPCKAMKPVVQGLTADMDDQVKVGMVDIDEECGLAGRLSVTNLPFFHIYKDGDLVDSWAGALPPASLKTRVAKYL